MKIVELTNKLLLPITNEEHELLSRFNDDPVAKSQLDEREQVLANQLTVKDVLLRTNEDGKIYYKKHTH
jgi:hypothetical protein